MEESIEDMIIRIRGKSRFNAELANEIRSLIKNKVQEASNNSSIVVTQQNLADMTLFSGMTVNSEGWTEEEMETEYTIEQNVKVSLYDNDACIYQGLAIHCTEYPEEGSIALNYKKESK